jgi:acetyltransferase
MPRHRLAPLFSPASVAVAGASAEPGTVGGRVWRNLVEGGYRGALKPVNPALSDLDGRPCFPALAALPAPPDLAVLALPDGEVQGALDAAARAGARAAILVGDRAPPAALPPLTIPPGLRVLGPGSLGLLRPSLGLAAGDFGHGAKRGSLALVSQSGALCSAVLDWAAARGIGFSAVVALGRGEGVGIGGVLDFLALDPETRGILLYLEGVSDARGFMSGLRAAARLKPVVAVKAGRHREGVRAVVSHAGALVGEDDVFEAALRRAGVVRAGSIDRLFAAAQLLSGRVRAAGDRLAILTNAGGPGIMAADRAVDLGLRLAEPDEAAVRNLETLCPGGGFEAQPLDLGGDAGPEQFAAALKFCLDDSGVDGALALFAPQAEARPAETAAAVVEAAASARKPVLASWLGEAGVREARGLFARHGLPSFASPESAVGALAVLAEFHRAQQLLLHVPAPLASAEPPDLAGARRIVARVLDAGRALLDPIETRALLRAFRIPANEAVAARDAGEAVAAAERLGYPVVLKVLSPDIVHKSDVDGVRLDLRGPGQVAEAFEGLVAAARALRPDARIEGVTVEPMVRRAHGRELLVGLVDDPVFGPAVSFGAGGTAVEVLRDRAVALPPLDADLARDLVGRTRAARLLDAFRNLPPVNRPALEDVLLRVSELACELPEIRELDINPLVADGQGVLALDACVVLRKPEPGGRRYSHMAIHPYPVDLAGVLALRDGSAVTVRPIRPEDAAMEQAFVRGLSAESRFFRFMNAVQELSPELLVRLTQLDYDRELALVAVAEAERGETQVAVARYSANPDGDSAEFALAVADAWQHRGLGRALMERLMDAARERGFRRLTGEVLADNGKMLGLMERLGFAVRRDPDDPGIRRVERALVS